MVWLICCHSLLNFTTLQGFPGQLSTVGLTPKSIGHLHAIDSRKRQENFQRSMLLQLLKMQCLKGPYMRRYSDLSLNQHLNTVKRIYSGMIAA
jgi:hypothetical protein